MMKIIALKISVEESVINITISRAPSFASEPCEFTDFMQAVHKVSECLSGDCRPGRPSISINTNDCNIISRRLLTLMKQSLRF